MAPSHGAQYAQQDYYGYNHPRPYPPPTLGPVAHGSPKYGGRGEMLYPAMGGNVEEREQKRRVAHSAMERRRRERTNNVIDTLKAMIPWLHDEARMQKLEVLEQCVHYIKELQQSAGVAGAAAPAKRKRGQSWPDSDGGADEAAAVPPAARRQRPSPQARCTRRRSGSPAAADAWSPSRVAPPGTAAGRLLGRPAALEAGAPTTPDLVSDTGTPSTASSAISSSGPLPCPLPPIKTAIGFLTL
ncbi:hypothetical protein IWQ57_000228 [Coemansia nantahalensis]|uniref:Uncharacterized protein n=1 Tax=Coemansia nantahalensis TaxID=2789366 RepID=A0ACC1K8P9_9FUNG|nr:hypothetical protein IWQ57_000228 [Coemansia nantahalensis]